MTDQTITVPSTEKQMTAFVVLEADAPTQERAQEMALAQLNATLSHAGKDGRRVFLKALAETPRFIQVFSTHMMWRVVCFEVQITSVGTEGEQEGASWLRNALSPLNETTAFNIRMLRVAFPPNAAVPPSVPA